MTTEKWLLDTKHPMFSHSFIGFDKLFNMLATSQLDCLGRDRNKTYPPYNILRDEYTYKIEMALAGMTDKDIEVVLEDKVLTVSYNKSDKEKTNQEVHRGIAHRSFRRSFNLADDIEVKEAKLSNGLLTITLERIVPEEKKPKKIKLVK
tara:strand:- start:8227 stop:8673 length:447 start_codon:yes stop_codon:yes gene_type:complete